MLRVDKIAQGALSVKNTGAGGDLLKPMDGFCIKKKSVQTGRKLGGFKLLGVKDWFKFPEQRYRMPPHFAKGFLW